MFPTPEERNWQNNRQNTQHFTNRHDQMVIMYYEIGVYTVSESLMFLVVTIMLLTLQSELALTSTGS